MSEAQLPRDADNEESEQAVQAPLHLSLVQQSVQLEQEPSIIEPAQQSDGKVVRSLADTGQNVIILPPPLPAGRPPSLQSRVEELSVWADVVAPEESVAPEYMNGSVSLAPADVSQAESESPDAHAVVPPAVAEISPIFSAIDEAERVEAAQQPLLASLVDAFDVGILVLAPPIQLSAETAPLDEPRPEDAVLHLQPLAAATDLSLPVEPDAAPDALFAESAKHAAQEVQSAPEDVSEETAEKIASEANATAIALEALRQLLTEKLPGLEAAAARQAAHRVTAPVSPPPMMPAHVAAASMAYARREEPPRRTGAMIGSFFAGFSLSWVLGAVLYMYLTGYLPGG